MWSNDSVIERSIAIFNEADPEKRRDLIAWTFTEDATYQDPLLAGAGHAQLDQMFAAAQAQFSGAQVVRSSEPEAHHDWVRFSWQVMMPGETESLIDGTDLGRIGEDGRFEQIIGFLDKVPAALAS
jgi:hypothetical protein